MIDYKNMVEELVKIIHQNIVDLHIRVREKYFWSSFDGWLCLLIFISMKRNRSYIIILCIIIYFHFANIIENKNY
jgi:hypothetical protein